MINKDTPMSELDLANAIAHGADIRYVDLDEDELFHWKYVKREKLPNGKWRYYYDWNELKTDVKNFVDDPTGSKRKKELDKAQKTYQDATNTIESRKMSSVEYRKAISDAKAAVSKGSQYVAKGYIEETAAYDLEKQAKAKSQLEKAQKAYEKTIPSKIEKTKDSIKGSLEGIIQKAQDFLGVDEERYKDYAYDMREKSRGERLENNNPETREKYQKWADEYVKANEEFMKTPLGIYTKASDAIDSFLYNISKTAGETYEKVRDHMDDAIFEAEYNTSHSLGVAQKEQYESAKKALENAERNLKRASGNEVYMAEFYYKQALKQYEKAKNAYNGTPMHTIETGRDYVANLFEDLFD